MCNQKNHSQRRMIIQITQLIMILKTQRILIRIQLKLEIPNQVKRQMKKVVNAVDSRLKIIIFSTLLLCENIELIYIKSIKVIIINMDNYSN